jgi:hypothetical protein
MNIGAWTGLIGAAAIVLGGIGTAAKLGGDQFWVEKEELPEQVIAQGSKVFITQDSYTKGEIQRKQLEIFDLEQKDSQSNRDKAKVEFLKRQIEDLRQELE